MQILVALSSIENTIKARGLNWFDIPIFLKRHGFAGLELSDRQLPSLDLAFFHQLRESCSAAGSRLVFDVNCDLTYSDPLRWQHEVDYVKGMLSIARELGAGALRVCLGGQALSIQKLLQGGRGSYSRVQGPSRPGIARSLLLNRWMLRAAHTIRRTMPSIMLGLNEKMERATRAIEALMPAAASHNVPVVIENHWGISSRPENIVAVLDAVNSPWLGTCPDFGNFPRGVDPYEGLRILAPKALHVQAKSARFRENGEEARIDYKRALGILRDCGYDGTLTIEYEGGGRDLEGCMRTRDLIRKYW
jgi:sugar phosphate isomerase/epimerase